MLALASFNCIESLNSYKSKIKNGEFVSGALDLDSTYKHL